MSLSPGLCISPRLCFCFRLRESLRLRLRVGHGQCLSFRQCLGLRRCLSLRQRLCFALNFRSGQAPGFHFGALGLFSDGGTLVGVGLGTGLVNGLGQARLQGMDTLDRALGLAGHCARALSHVGWQAQRLLAKGFGQAVDGLALFDQFGHRPDAGGQHGQRGRQSGRSQPPAALVQVCLQVPLDRIQGFDLRFELGGARLALALQLRSVCAQRRHGFSQCVVPALALLGVGGRQGAAGLCQQSRQLLAKVSGLCSILRQLFCQCRGVGQERRAP